MKKYNKMIIGLVSILSLTGCTGQEGNQKIAAVQDHHNISQKLIHNQTTKEEARKILGDPDDIDFMENGYEKWIYKHTRRDVKIESYVPVVNWFVKGTDDTTTKLILMFDKNILRNFSFTKSKGETNIGLSN